MATPIVQLILLFQEGKNGLPEADFGKVFFT